MMEEDLPHLQQWLVKTNIPFTIFAAKDILQHTITIYENNSRQIDCGVEFVCFTYMGSMCV